jgi:hypothetical protein
MFATLFFDFVFGFFVVFYFLFFLTLLLVEWVISVSCRPLLFELYPCLHYTIVLLFWLFFRGSDFCILLFSKCDFLCFRIQRSALSLVSFLLITSGTLCFSVEDWRCLQNLSYWCWIFCKRNTFNDYWIPFLFRLKTPTVCFVVITRVCSFSLPAGLQEILVL